MWVNVLVASLIALFGLMYWQAPERQIQAGAVPSEPARVERGLCALSDTGRAALVQWQAAPSPSSNTTQTVETFSA
jgi:hypothetical protein